MKTTVFLITSLASSEKLGDKHPEGIMLHRLQPSESEKAVFDFSRTNIVASVDLTKTSLKSAANYFIENIADLPGEHFIDMAGRRIPISDTATIFGEVEKIDRHYEIRRIV